MDARQLHGPGGGGGGGPAAPAPPPTVPPTPQAPRLVAYGAQQDPAGLRRLKEAFVSHLDGTTRWEVFCVLSSMPLCLLIAAYVEARVSARLRSSSLLSKRPWWLAPPPKFAYEFCGGVLPLLLLLMSVAPAEPAFLLLFLLWGSMALKLWMRIAHGPAARQHSAHMLAHLGAPRKRAVSAFRGGVMAATCCSILGVDFTAFPRRYAKAETYGGGVMDVGVGAILFAGGLVSSVAAAAAAASATGAAGGGGGAAGPGGSSAAPAQAAAGGGGGGGGGASGAAAAAAAAGGSGGVSSSCRQQARAWAARLARGLSAALPLLLLGSARQLATSAVGYQAHLGEYGLHWNFFYTIAAVALLTLALPVPPRWLGPLGLALSAGHQLLLSLDLTSLLAPGGAAAGVAGQGGGGAHARIAQLLPGLLSTAANSTAVGSSSSRSSSSQASLGAWLMADLSVEARQAAGFWASNKEGLGSLPGYWSLHLLGAAVGAQLSTSAAATAGRARAALFGDRRPPGGSAVGECGRLVWAWVGSWWVLDLLLWGLLAAVEAAVEPVSRRTCNLPYVLWTTAQCLAWLLLVLMAELLSSVICSTSGGCSISSSGATAAHATAAAGGGAGGGKGPVRRSLDAAMAAVGGAAAGPAPPGAQAGGQGSSQQQQQGCAPPGSPASNLHRRSAGQRRGASSPMAAAAAAAAALTAAAVGGGGSIAGGTSAAVLAAATAAVDASAGGSSSREGSPRKPVQGGKGAGGSQQQQHGSGSPGSGGSSAGSGTPGRPARGRHSSRLAQGDSSSSPVPAAAPGPSVAAVATASTASSSGGPLRLMLAFNRNMLALFLIANLLTGAINLSVNTLEVGPWAARLGVGCYMLVLCGLAVRLDAAGVTLKFR